MRELYKFTFRIESTELVQLRERTLVQVNLQMSVESLCSKWVYFFGVKEPVDVSLRGLGLVRLPRQKVSRSKFYHFERKFHAAAFGIDLVESKVANKSLKTIQYKVELVRPCPMPDGAFSLELTPFTTLLVKGRRPLSVADKLSNFISMLQQTEVISGKIMAAFIKRQESNQFGNFPS